MFFLIRCSHKLLSICCSDAWSNEILINESTKWGFCLLALLLGWFAFGPYRATKQGCMIVTTKVELHFRLFRPRTLHSNSASQILGYLKMKALWLFALNSVVSVACQVLGAHLPQSASRSLTMSTFVSFSRWSQQRWTKGFSQTATAKCAALSSYPSPRGSPIMRWHIALHDTTDTIHSCGVNEKSYCFSSAPRDTWLIYTPEPYSLHAVNKRTWLHSVFFILRTILKKKD